MKYTIKFRSNKDCMLTIDSGAPINLQAGKISKGQLAEGFYLFEFSQGDDTISVEYPHIKPEFEDMIRVDWNKKEIVSCILPALTSSIYNPAHRHITKDDSGKYFLIDVESGWKKELPYKYVTQFRSDGYAVVVLSNCYASNGAMERKGDVGLINKAGEIIVPLCYRSISEVSNGYMLATTYTYENPFATTILDENGIILFTRQAYLGSRKDGVNPTVCKDGLIRTYETYENKCGLGYINLQNEIVISPMYEGIERCGYNLFKVQLSGKYGLVDKSEQILIPFEYGGMIPFQIGPQKDWNFVFIVRHDGEEKYRVINCQNIPFFDNKQFDSYKIYSNGIWLKIESLWLFYDKNLSFIAEYPDEQIIFDEVVCIKEGEQIKPIPFLYPQAIKYHTQCIDNE